MIIEQSLRQAVKQIQAVVEQESSGKSEAELLKDCQSKMAQIKSIAHGALKIAGSPTRTLTK